MRTTMVIDDDLLMAAKQIAVHQKITAGEMVSKLLRQALAGQPFQTNIPSATGFRPFAARGVVVSDLLINQLREAEGI